MPTQQELEFSANLKLLQSEILKEAQRNLLGRSGNKISEQERNNIAGLKIEEISLENFPMFGKVLHEPSFISNLNIICSNGLLEDFVSQFSSALSAQSNYVFSLREKNLQREVLPGIAAFGVYGVFGNHLRNISSGIKYELVIENSRGLEDKKKLFWLGVVPTNLSKSNYDEIPKLFTVQAGKFVAEKTLEGKISPPNTSPRPDHSDLTSPLLGNGGRI